ncbi:MAG TPA: 7-carboxy-7-deazaguanine synthase QueE [Candidatus Dojkabacteria bacterium]|nr:7-carboxy-7-deazaguanine synthase QueE [Candidatus Dojkabacteria bacterium]
MASFGIITQLCTTIQGEGPTAGKSCLLIRVGNCILNCSYCDTKWTNNLKPLAVPRLTSTTDSLPFKIDTVSSMNIFIDLCRQHVKNYNISHVLITGGEPLMNLEFLEKLFKNLKEKLNINSVEIETNGVLLDLTIAPLVRLNEMKVQLNISPKLNPDFYPNKDIKSIYDIIRLFQTKYAILDKLIKILPADSISANFKFVYYKEIEENLNEFIESVNPKIPIVIMPLTPDYTKYKKEFSFIQAYRKSCYDAIDYCLRKNYTFSPRLHIWVFNNFKHRNEFEDCKK